MDIELLNPDNSLIDSGTSPYDHEYGDNYELIKSIGFNWSDLGVVTPPSNIATFVGYVNATNSGENFTDSLYVGIAFPSNIVMSVSNTAGRYEERNYSFTAHKYSIVASSSNYKISRYQDTSSQPWTLLLLADYDAGGLYTPGGKTWRAGWDTPYVNADIVISDTTGDRIAGRISATIHNYFYGSSSNTVCDAYVFSDAIDATEENATFKFKNWGNLQNMPVGKLPSDYTVGVKYSTHLNPDSGLVAAFTSKSGVIEKSYLELFETLTPSEQTTAISNGYMDFKFVLRHGLTVATEDSFHIVRLYPNGNMTLRYETAPGQLHVKPWTSPYDNDLYDDDDGILIQQVPGQQMSVDNLLTTSYALTDNELEQFGSFLWSNNEPATNYKEMQTAPIENVISCKRIPFEVPDVGSDPKVEIHCGNVRTGVMAYKALSTHKQDIGVITIPAYTHDYLDFENNISIYLPYCGIQMIPTGLCYKRKTSAAKDANGNDITYKDSNNQTVTAKVAKVVGRKLGVVYYYDIVYGSCCALLYIDAEWDSTNNEVTGGNLIAAFNGDCGVDIPITASNRAANELALRKAGDSMIAGAVMGAAGGFVTGGAVGGLLGGALGLAGGFANKAVQQRNQDTHYTTSGGFSSQIASYMSKTVTLFVEHTTYKKDPLAYAHENGYPCNLTLNMKDLKGLGYTELSGEIEISGIDCLEEERDGLKQALMEGFYVSDNTALAPMIGVVD